MIKIGISACMSYPDANRIFFKNKTLLYIETSLAHWVSSQNALPLMIPTIPSNSGIHFRDFSHELDGLILHGGVDVAPESYGESPLLPQWSGDRKRDIFEITLMNEFMARNKPVFGICRGAHIMNVALGGTLYQDINTQIPNSLNHRNSEIYDQNFHEINFLPGSHLQRLYNGIKVGKVNSVHHQGIRKLANSLEIEARSEADGVIEAIRHKSAPYLFAVQWHPEFIREENVDLLESTPIIRDFLDWVRKRKEKNKCYK